MPKVILHKHESFEKAMRRFKKAVDKADILKDCRKHEFFEKPAQVRVRSKAAAKKREQRRVAQSKLEPKYR